MQYDLNKSQNAAACPAFPTSVCASPPQDGHGFRLLIVRAPVRSLLIGLVLCGGAGPRRLRENLNFERLAAVAAFAFCQVFIIEKPAVMILLFVAIRALWGVGRECVSHHPSPREKGVGGSVSTATSIERSVCANSRQTAQRIAIYASRSVRYRTPIPCVPKSPV